MTLKPGQYVLVDAPEHVHHGKRGCLQGISGDRGMVALEETLVGHPCKNMKLSLLRIDPVQGVITPAMIAAGEVDPLR